MNKMIHAMSVAALATSALYASAVLAQSPPSFDDANPSPNAGSGVSQRANAAADKTLYRDVNYTNANKQGPALIVIPGEIKSNNATFTQKFGPNNIADYAELELGKANFRVLERTDLGPILNEFTLAYTMGDPDAARKVLQKGKFKTTKWVVKFDILKAEPVAQQSQGFNGAAAGNIIGMLGRGSLGGNVAGSAVGSVDNSQAASVWVVGMRYKIMDANTTEQVAQGYTEEKMEVGAKSNSVLGMSNSEQGGVTLDTLVQRLVQKSVWEIDYKDK
jgi:hypothetical protein